MDDQARVPKKRGRKPLPPEEKSKRGRKRIVHQEIQERKKEGAPPLQISFVCDDTEKTAPAGEAMSSSSQGLNPFFDHSNHTSSSTSISNHNSSSTPKSTKTMRVPQPKNAVLTALEESDDDEHAVVSLKPRVDVSHLSGEKCIEILGAHTDRDKWPSETDVSCWNCTFPFDGIPISIPGRLHKKKAVLIDCYGVFCSFNCARRYCMNRNRHNSFEQLELISFLHKKVLGQFARIPPAPPFQTLARFGGYMSIDEYRQNFISLPPKDDMFDESVRKEHVQLLEKNSIPLFQTVLHTHNQQLMTDSIQERKVREGYDRTKPLPWAQNFATSMGIQRTETTNDGTANNKNVSR